MTIPPQAETSQWIEPDGSATPSDLWDFFPNVYCITLKSRPDRRETAAAAFARVGLGGRVTYFLAEKHPTDSEQGIYESHQACLRAGLARGSGPIVVFEDDVTFRHYSPKTLAGAIDFLRGTDWQAFFFGCYVHSSESTRNRHVRSIRYKCTAHAYVVTRELAEKIVALPWSGVAFDDLLRNLDTGHYFMACPAFAFQSGATTDNDKQLKLDRMRRIFGGMYFGQRWDEFSHRRWRSMIVMHILSILLIAGILWLIFRP